jgi:hypothetical protein
MYKNELYWYNLTTLVRIMHEILKVPGGPYSVVISITPPNNITLIIYKEHRVFSREYVFSDKVTALHGLVIICRRIIEYTSK